MMDLKDSPGLVILSSGEVKRTTKVKKFIEKNKISDYQVIYLDPEPEDFRLVERELKALENKYLGLGELKEKPTVQKREFPYVYRYNINTLLCGYNEEAFIDLLKDYGVYEDYLN